MSLIVSLDIDGSITEFPAFFSQLSELIMKAGGIVYIITGFLPNEAPERATEAGREEQIEACGLTKGNNYVGIYICPGKDEVEVGKGKEAVCRRLGVQMHFDNDVKFASEVEHVTPVSLLVGPTLRS